MINNLHSSGKLQDYLGQIGEQYLLLVDDYVHQRLPSQSTCGLKNKYPQ